MVRVKSSQKFFTADEVSSVTGICFDHLQALARNKHLGTLVQAAESCQLHPGRKLAVFCSDLMILTVIHPRCEH